MNAALIDGGRSWWVKGAWFAVIVLAGLAASFALWDPLDTDERAHLRQLTAQTVRSVRADLDADVRSRLMAQVRLAELLGWEEPGQLLSGIELTLNSRLFLDHYPSEIGLQWVDADYYLRWAVGRQGEQVRLNVPIARSARPLLQAMVEGKQSVVISPAYLDDGKRVVRIAVPVVRNGANLGFLIAFSDIRATVDGMLSDHSGLGYSFSVIEGTEEIYRTPNASRTNEAKWAQEVLLPLPGTSWRIRAWPDASLIAAIRSSLPELAGALGGLLGSAMLLTFHFARAAQHRSKELSEARDQLEQRVRERTLDLQRINEDLVGQVAKRRRAEDSLRNLSGRLLRLQDDERRRIARDLHDSTTQILGAVSISLDQATQLAHSRGFGTLADLLESSREHLESANQELRTVSYLLHPPILDELGLEYVLPWYVQGFSKRSGIEVALDVQADLGRLSDDVEVTFFRIVQEALSNIHRHSGSPTATITVFRDASTGTLEISDEGCGVPPEVLEPTPDMIPNIGVGIVGMRERVGQLGGTLAIASSDHGTTIRVVLPLAADLAQPRSDRAAANTSERLGQS
jgi:signal transduction histidine kinase